MPQKTDVTMSYNRLGFPPRPNYCVSLRDKFLGNMLVLVLGLIPVYLFSSGGFQIVDIIILPTLIALLLVKKEKIAKHNTKYIFNFLFFAIWSVIINVLFYYYYEDRWFILGSIPLIYAFFLLYAFYYLFLKLINKKNIGYIYAGLVLSIILCFTIKGYSSEEGRTALSFNDPNQLGYLAVLLISYIIILMEYKRKFKIKNIRYKLIDIFVIIITHVMVLLSVSRTAMVAFLILDVCLIKNIRKIYCIILSLILIGCLTIILQPRFIQDRISQRPGQFQGETIIEHLKSRLFYPFKGFETHYILIGKGTGKSPDFIIEVHNLFGEILRAFGLIGLGLFIFWLIRFIGTIRVINDSIWIMAAIVTFNMGINGLRWRGLWIFMGFLLAMSSILSVQESKGKKQLSRLRPADIYPPGCQTGYRPARTRLY